MSETEPEVKLYANKFKTVEELEAGYKNSLPTFQENETLKQKVAELSAVPASYLNPNDVQLDQNRLSNLQQRAKDTGMTQTQYEKFVRGEKSLLDGRQQQFENARKELGEEKINVLKDYVEKYYPKAIAENMLNTFIGNKEARDAALAHREQILNTQVPGLSRPAAVQYTVSDEDVRKAYMQKEKTKSSKDIANYMNLINAQAAQRQSA